MDQRRAAPPTQCCPPYVGASRMTWTLCLVWLVVLCLPCARGGIASLLESNQKTGSSAWEEAQSAKAEATVELGKSPLMREGKEEVVKELLNLELNAEDALRCTQQLGTQMCRQEEKQQGTHEWGHEPLPPEQVISSRSEPEFEQNQVTTIKEPSQEEPEAQEPSKESSDNELDLPHLRELLAYSATNIKPSGETLHSYLPNQGNYAHNEGDDVQKQGADAYKNGDLMGFRQQVSLHSQGGGMHNQGVSVHKEGMDAHKQGTFVDIEGGNLHKQEAAGTIKRSFRMHDPSQLGLLEPRGAEKPGEVTPQKDNVEARIPKGLHLGRGRLARAGVYLWPEKGEQGSEKSAQQEVDDHTDHTKRKEEASLMEEMEGATTVEGEPTPEQQSSQAGESNEDLVSSKRQLDPQTQEIDFPAEVLFPSSLLAPVMKAHRTRMKQRVLNASDEFSFEAREQTEPTISAQRSLVIAETLNDLGPSHLKVALPELDVDLFVYRVVPVKIKGEWVLRFLSFLQDPDPKIWWGSQGGNSAKATELKGTCHFQGFVKEKLSAQASSSGRGNLWGDFMHALRLDGKHEATSSASENRPLRDADLDRKQDGEFETEHSERGRRALLSGQDGSLPRSRKDHSFHYAHSGGETEGSQEGRVSVGGIWWGGDRMNIERVTKAKREHSSPPPPKKEERHVTDSKAAAVTARFEVAATVRVNYDAIATRSGHVNAAYSMFLECKLPPELGSFLESMTGDHMISANLKILPGGQNESLAMRLVLDPNPPKQNFLAGCMGPIFGHVDERPWMEWIEYHRHVIGLDHLYVYVHELANLEHFQHYVDDGLVTFRHWQPTAPPDVLEKAHRYYDQTLINIDCLLRNRHKSEWVMFVDLDEYVQVSSRFNYDARTMLAHFPAHWAALKLKRIRYLVAPEVEQEGRTLVEKFVKHSRKHEHGDKTFMRPDKVAANGVHYVDVLEEPEGPLEYAVQQLSLLDARVNHYWRPLHRISQTDTFGSELNDKFRPFDQVEGRPENIARLSQMVHSRVEYRLAERLRRALIQDIENATIALSSAEAV